MSTTTYHPKGSMCMVCEHKYRDCSGLDFKSMRVIQQYSHANDPNVFKVVKCGEFIK